MPMKWRACVSSCIALPALFGLLAATRPAVAEEARVEGLWEGAIVFSEAEREFEITVEIGRDPDGELVGTIDQRAERMIYHPLEYVRIDGREVAFEFRKDSERRGPDAPFPFVGELSEDGQRITGKLGEASGQIPFHLTRVGEPGSERRTFDSRPVEDLGEHGEELKAAFNQAGGDVRLVMLLSPT